MHEYSSFDIPESVAKRKIALPDKDEVSFTESLVRQFANALGKQGVCYGELALVIEDENFAKMVAGSIRK